MSNLKNLEQLNKNTTTTIDSQSSIQEPEPRTFKGFLLEMKLAESYEERVLAEETLVKMHEELKRKYEFRGECIVGMEKAGKEFADDRDKYREQAEKLAIALKRIYDTERKPGGRHRHDEDADDVAAEALTEYEAFKRGMK